jgi:hypothetical protein
MMITILLLLALHAPEAIAMHEDVLLKARYTAVEGTDPEYGQGAIERNDLRPPPSATPRVADPRRRTCRSREMAGQAQRHSRPEARLIHRRMRDPRGGEGGEGGEDHDATLKVVLPSSVREPAAERRNLRSPQRELWESRSLNVEPRSGDISNVATRKRRLFR